MQLGQQDHKHKNNGRSRQRKIHDLRQHISKSVGLVHRCLPNSGQSEDFLFRATGFLTLIAPSAASLANRRDLNRAVLARMAIAAASYSSLAFAPSSALWAFLNLASARSRV